MRLANVNQQKLDLAVIFFIKVAKADRLPYEGWSGKAAEDQGDRFLSTEIRESNGFAPVNSKQFEIGCFIAHLRSQV